MAANFWSFLPALLLSVAIAIFIYRQLYPISKRMITAPIPPEVDTAPSYNEKRPGLSNTLVEIDKARRVARIALAESKGNFVGAMSRMESALTSTEKTFDIDTPEGVGDARKNLRLWLDYFEAVWPFLENGNYEHAKGKAVNFIVERKLQIRPR